MLQHKDHLTLVIPHPMSIGVTTQRALKPTGRFVKLKEGDKVSITQLSTRKEGNRRCRIYFGRDGFTTSTEELNRVIPGLCD